jgi:EAL domain-containing protein (putative c-di-GMP-specific phosphodiesterase class I)
VSVGNVSPVQLAEPGWAAEVMAVMDITQLPPWQLQLEITELAVVRDESGGDGGAVGAACDRCAARARRLRHGYSGLAWLRRLPVHALKIEGSFVDGLRHRHADPVDRSIVEALIRMAMLDLKSRPNGWRRRSKWSG